MRAAPIQLLLATVSLSGAACTSKSNACVPAGLTVTGDLLVQVTAVDASHVTIDFGDVALGTAITSNLIVTACPEEDLVGFATEMPSDSAFDFGAYTGSAITPGGLRLPAVFAPASLGFHSAVYELDAEQQARSQTLTLTLQGTGMPSAPPAVNCLFLPPELPAVLDFGFVQPAQTLVLTLPFKNVGCNPITLSQQPLIVFNPTPEQVGDPGPFTIGTPQVFPYTIAGGEEVDFQVGFSSSTLDQFKGEVTILSNAAGGPAAVVNLAGYGGGASIDCQPPSLDFGDVPLGTSATLPITCTNVGTDVSGHPEAALAISESGVQVLPPFSAALEGDPVSLAAGAAATIEVTFAAQAADAGAAELSIASNDLAHPMVLIPLSGRGK